MMKGSKVLKLCLIFLILASLSFSMSCVTTKPQVEVCILSETGLFCSIKGINRELPLSSANNYVCFSPKDAQVLYNELVSCGEKAK